MSLISGLNESSSARLKAKQKWCVTAMTLWCVFVCKLRGHYAYFGVSNNIRSLCKVDHRAKRLLYRWVNKRGQKKCMNWEQFNNYLLLNPLPRPKIYYSLYASSGSR